MGVVVHTSRIKIVREKGPTRRAMIEGFMGKERTPFKILHFVGASSGIELRDT
jgi:hypothetical protein